MAAQASSPSSPHGQNELIMGGAQTHLPTSERSGCFPPPCREEEVEELGDEARSVAAETGLLVTELGP
jgi:hypothetical protein